MASITKEQVVKMNSEMGNGFRLDIGFYCTWKEKHAVKIIKTGEDEDNNYYIRACIGYWEDGPAWKSNTYNIELLMEYFKAPKADKFMSSSERKRFVISSGHEKKMFSKIQKETHKWPDEKILDLYNTIDFYKYAGEL